MAKSKRETAKITRISASEPKSEVVSVATVKVATKKETARPRKRSILSPFRPMIGYFKGAWYELKQVRWPNRRATWGLTGAVLIFSAFCVVLILLLDVLFKFLFEQILV